MQRDPQLPRVIQKVATAGAIEVGEGCGIIEDLRRARHGLRSPPTMHNKLGDVV